MFKEGQVLSREEVNAYIMDLDSEFDKEMLDVYTGIFSKYKCVMLNLSNLKCIAYVLDDEDIIDEYSQNVSNMPPLLVSPLFNGERVIYDGCHRYHALLQADKETCLALIPYEMNDGRLVEDAENNPPEIHSCKNGECERGKCCLCCEYNKDCPDICSLCFDVGAVCDVIGHNVSLFCDKVWR